MGNEKLLFLDFDGVICDSLMETLVSSWRAYHQFILHDAPSVIAADFKSIFARYRPFIRNSEDYILIQHIIFHGLNVLSQADFNALKIEAGESVMAQYQKVMNDARLELLEGDREYWLSLSPVFPPIRTALMKNPRHPGIFILSTKRKEYIDEILSAQQIEVLDRNIIVSGNQNKLDIIRRVMDACHAQRALFIDDQIEHLKAAHDDRIEVFLAAWGYVKKEWLHNEEKIPVLTISSAVSCIEKI
ncbi:MAG: HAD family hydrolase [Spirochaetales bacterium]|nr:HAD family hydrolase [Spirochaetales bacterium]